MFGESTPSDHNAPVPARSVLICVAIQLEANAIARALELTFDASRTRATGIVRSDLSVQLQVVGMRASAMPESLDASQIGLVISAGLAGALDPRLRCGDVVREHRIHTADEVVATVAQKQKLFQQTAMAAVDMESARIRRVADRAGIPFIAIRAISDTADEAIDPAVLGLVDPLGRPKPAALVAALTRRPGLISTLLRLRKNAKVAAESMTEALATHLISVARSGDELSRNYH